MPEDGIFPAQQLIKSELLAGRRSAKADRLPLDLAGKVLPRLPGGIKIHRFKAVPAKCFKRLVPIHPSTSCCNFSLSFYFRIDAA